MAQTVALRVDVENLEDVEGVEDEWMSSAAAPAPWSSPSLEAAVGGSHRRWKAEAKHVLGGIKMGSVFKNKFERI
jgi:hypothetical protein